MNEEYVKICEYELDREIIAKCREEDRDITSKDVRTELQEVLEENGIEYKNKLVEEWRGKRIAKYFLLVEVYVLKEDEEKTKKLLGNIR